MKNILKISAILAAMAWLLFFSPAAKAFTVAAGSDASVVCDNSTKSCSMNVTGFGNCYFETDYTYSATDNSSIATGYIDSLASTTSPFYIYAENAVTGQWEKKLSPMPAASARWPVPAAMPEHADKAIIYFVTPSGAAIATGAGSVTVWGRHQSVQE